MSLYERAAQFSPFAALVGQDAAIKECARLTQRRTEQSEDMLRRLNEKLRLIADNPDTEVTVTYFVPDAAKDGGAYISRSGTVRRIDYYAKTLVMADRTLIPIEQISEIEGELFDTDSQA